MMLQQRKDHGPLGRQMKKTGSPIGFRSMSGDLHLIGRAKESIGGNYNKTYAAAKRQKLFLILIT